MDRGLRDRWVAALRSGHYKQGKGNLRICKDEYCCLGVLLDVYDPSGWKDCSYDKNGHNGYTVIEIEIGVDSCVDGPFVTMNDHDDKSFSEIADYIEDKL